MGGELDDLKKAVQLHEKYLSILLESKREDEESYRVKHRELGLRFEQFEKRFKSLKKNVFALVEQINKEKEQ